MQQVRSEEETRHPDCQRHYGAQRDRLHRRDRRSLRIFFTDAARHHRCRR